MEYLEFIKANWVTITGVFVIMVIGGFYINRWLDKPKAQQLADLKEWLKFAVVEAEKMLGSKTGELKLRLVYDKALCAFPWLTKFIPFESFNVYVMEALEWMEKELAENPSIAAYIEK